MEKPNEHEREGSTTPVLYPNQGQPPVSENAVLVSPDMAQAQQAPMPGQPLPVDQHAIAREDFESYVLNSRIIAENPVLYDVQNLLPYLMSTSPIPQPIPLGGFENEMAPLPEDTSELVYSDAVFDKLNLNHLIRDPTTILAPYHSIQLINGYDPEDYSLVPYRWQILVLGPKTDDSESSKFLFSAVQHIEPFKNCCQKQCTCCIGCCEEVFLWQVNYKFKNQTFASIYKSAKCPCCYLCCESCIDCCAHHRDISKVRITKFPRLDYIKASKLIGKTGIPTNCCAKTCGPTFCCNACDPGDGIDYYDETTKKYKYRLGFPKRPCCKRCVCCIGGGAPCCKCCLDTARKEHDYYALIVDLEKKAITGYIVLKQASTGIIPGCCQCCKVPEFYYPNVHIEIIFPVDATPIDKFMILNLVVCWYYRAPYKRLYFPLYSFIMPEEIMNFEKPTDEEMKFFV